MISIKQTPVYTTSDGQQHPTRDAAVAREIYLARLKNLNAISFTNVYSAEAGEFSGGAVVIPVSAISNFIADNASAILEALTIKQNRGRAAKSAAPDAATTNALHGLLSTGAGVAA